MDSLITAAARALAAGDPLGALQRVALRGDAPALALRGIAMAQLGDLARARALLRAATRGFGPREVVARARTVVAEAEVALALRDLAASDRALAAARAVLAAHGDRGNALHARLLEARRLLLLGRLDEAETALAELADVPLSPAHAAVRELVAGGIAVRRLRAEPARAALRRAAAAARRAGIPTLLAEVEAATEVLALPAARRIENAAKVPSARGAAVQTLRLADVEALFAADTFVVDACRRAARCGGRVVPLATRPVLFALLLALGEAWPGDVERGTLIARAFGGRHADESHRARLRVEMGRLRRALAALAELCATPRGFALVPRRGRPAVVLVPPLDEPRAEVLALLADGESWSSSALAVALSTSQRSVQRALDELAAAGKAQAIGSGRARRWVAAPLPGFATALLLPAPWPLD